jgi:hypothetical protein
MLKTPCPLFIKDGITNAPNDVEMNKEIIRKGKTATARTLIIVKK